MASVWRSVTNVCRALKDLKEKINRSYHGIKEDLERMSSEWKELEKRTLSKIDETEEYLKPFAGKEPEEAEVEKIARKAGQLSKEFDALYKEHNEMKARTGINGKFVEKRYEDSEQMKSQIALHGKNAWAAAVVVGMIVGGSVGWFRWNNEILFAVLGALIGGGALLALGGVVYFSFLAVAVSGVKKWKDLQERVPEFKKMEKSIAKKKKDLFPVSMELDMIANGEKGVPEGASEVVERFNSYRDITTA